MSKISETVYDYNYKISEGIASIPYIGDEFLGLVKFTCDYVINPLVIGGTHAGCDAVEDVYHGLPSNLDTPKKPISNEQQR